MSEKASCKYWYARVKFRDDHIEDVQLCKIKKADGTPFRPSNCDDFSSTELFKAKTLKGTADGAEHAYPAVIGRIAETLAALQGNNKRISWPSVWPQSSEAPNSSQGEEDNRPSSSVIVLQRSVKAARTKKKQAAAVEYGKFLQSNPISMPQSSSSSPQCSTSSTPAIPLPVQNGPTTTRSDGGQKPSESQSSESLSNAALIKRVKELEAELKRSKESQGNIKTVENVQEFLVNFERKVDFKIQQAVRNACGSMKEELQTTVKEIVSASMADVVKRKCNSSVLNEGSYVYEWINRIPKTDSE